MDWWDDNPLLPSADLRFSADRLDWFDGVGATATVDVVDTAPAALINWFSDDEDADHYDDDVQVDSVVAACTDVQVDSVVVAACTDVQVDSVVAALCTDVQVAARRLPQSLHLEKSRIAKAQLALSRATNTSRSSLQDLASQLNGKLVRTGMRVALRTGFKRKGNGGSTDLVLWARADQNLSHMKLTPSGILQIAYDAPTTLAEALCLGSAGGYFCDFVLRFVGCFEVL